MKIVWSIVFPILIILPPIILWAVPLIGAYCITPQGNVIGGCKLPTTLRFLGCLYAPDRIGIYVLLLSFVLYTSVFAYWALRASVSDISPNVASGFNELEVERTALSSVK
jgi:hypothetical protein